MSDGIVVFVVVPAVARVALVASTVVADLAFVGIVDFAELEANMILLCSVKWRLR